MRKALVVTIGLMIATAWSVNALAVGSPGNWYADLTFSTSNSTDYYPIRIGESSAAINLLKPPPMPGMALTGNPADAIVNAYVLTSSAKQAARSIEIPSSTAPGKVWAIQVQVEEAGADVNMKADLKEFNWSEYKLSVINPDTGEIVSFTTDGQKQKIFTAVTAGVKTVYVMASKSQSFVAAIGGKMFGSAKIMNVGAAKGASIYDVNQSTTNPIATVDDNGSFSIESLSVGQHVLRIDALRAVGSEVTVDVTADGASPFAINDLFPGDFNDDGKISLQDIMALKKTYNKRTGDPDYKVECDINGDGVVSILDLMKMKPGYNKKESWK